MFCSFNSVGQWSASPFPQFNTTKRWTSILIFFGQETIQTHAFVSKAPLSIDLVFPSVSLSEYSTATEAYRRNKSYSSTPHASACGACCCAMWASRQSTIKCPLVCLANSWLLVGLCAGLLRPVRTELRRPGTKISSAWEDPPRLWLLFGSDLL